MGKRTIIVLGVLLAMVVGLIGWQLWTRQRFVYEGKNLNAWLEQYGTSHWLGNARRGSAEQAEQAIRSFGTNAIPVYLNMISTHESPLKLKLLRFWPGMTAKLEHRAGEQRRRGAYGIAVLKGDAQPAVPALVNLLNHKDPDVRYCAVFALRSLGPVSSNALPALINCLNDSEFTVRDDAILALGTIHQQPERVVPLLRKVAETSSDAILSSDAKSALREFGIDPDAPQTARQVTNNAENRNP